MSKDPRKDRSVGAARILAGLCVALAAMCAGLAWAWTHERETAACWRTAAMFQLVPEDECGD